METDSLSCAHMQLNTISSPLGFIKSNTFSKQTLHTSASSDCFIWRFDCLSRQNERVCRSIKAGDKWKDWTRTGRGELLTAALQSFELSCSFPSHFAAKRRCLPKEMYYRGHLDTTQTCSHTNTQNTEWAEWSTPGVTTSSLNTSDITVWTSAHQAHWPPPTNMRRESLPDPDSSSNMLACGVSSLFVSKSQNPYPMHACCSISWPLTF